MRRPPRTAATALVAASFLALFEVFRTTMTQVHGEPPDRFLLLHRIVPMWLSIVIASPWCAYMANRFPFRAGHTVRTLGAHLGGAVVFVVIHLTLLLVGHVLLNGAGDLPTGFGLAHLYLYYVAMEISVYGAIVIVLLFLEARRDAAARAIATVRLERSVTVARLESLQAQIRPHFLFNTLNALAVLARRGDGAAVDSAIGDLGELLRASFEAPGPDPIPLADELAFVERYLRLQHIRFPDRLVVDLAIAEETRRARVPPLLIQPLVENAIEHGLARSQGGRIRIAARRDGAALVIEVEDDGAGLADPAGAGGTHGVGLANTRERLALLYGGAGVLEIGQRAGGGACARVRIPWDTGPVAAA